MSSNSITELANALRDAANRIEQASRFGLDVDINLSDAVAMIQVHKSPTNEATLNIAIYIPKQRDDDGPSPTVTYSISESYKKAAEAGSLKACVDIFTSTKVANHTLNELSKIASPPERPVALPAEFA